MVSGLSLRFREIAERVKAWANITKRKNLEFRPYRNPNVLWRTEYERTLILDIDTGNVAVFGGIATRTWELCDGNHSVKDVVSEISSVYPEVDHETVQKDTVWFIRRARKSGLLLSYREVTEKST